MHRQPQWPPPREFAPTMYTEQPYEAQMPRQQLVYVQPPPPYYWPQHPPHPPHWQPPEYQHHPRHPRHEAPREDPDDAAAGFQRLEVAVKSGVEDATRRGLARDVHVKQRQLSGVTRTAREWKPIWLRVSDDDGAPEFKQGLMESVLQVVRDVKEQLQSNLRPTHVAAAVGALDVLREVLLYYKTVVGGAAESEPRYEAESASDLTRLLAHTAQNAKEVAEGVRKAARARTLTPAMLVHLDEATAQLLLAYKAYNVYAALGGAGAPETAAAHVSAMVADAGLPA